MQFCLSVCVSDRPPKKLVNNAELSLLVLILKLLKEEKNSFFSTPYQGWMDTSCLMMMIIKATMSTTTKSIKTTKTKTTTVKKITTNMTMAKMTLMVPVCRIFLKGMIKMIKMIKIIESIQRDNNGSRILMDPKLFQWITMYSSFIYCVWKLHRPKALSRHTTTWTMDIVHSTYQHFLQWLGLGLPQQLFWASILVVEGSVINGGYPVYF